MMSIRRPWSRKSASIFATQIGSIAKEDRRVDVPFPFTLKRRLSSWGKRGNCLWKAWSGRWSLGAISRAPQRSSLGTFIYDHDHRAQTDSAVSISGNQSSQADFLYIMHYHVTRVRSEINDRAKSSSLPRPPRQRLRMPYIPQHA